MIQSTSALPNDGPHALHVAIIMDGNGRWAERRGLPRLAGHRAGAEAVRRIVEAAPGLGLTTLTLFAFSSDNWRRPGPEVRALFRLLGRYALAEARECVRRGVRMSFPGRRDRLPPTLQHALAEAETLTARGRALRLRIAVDYSSRHVIACAAAHIGAVTAHRDALLKALGEAAGESEAAPEVDLLIRTGGERRLSDFLLFESAYAELEFIDQAWPEFGPADLAGCVARFHARDRRFGGLTHRAAG